MISDPDIFISSPSYLNVLQSSHQAWLFFSEIMFYGYLPWESLIALTTANWRWYSSVRREQGKDGMTNNFQEDHVEFFFLL